MNAGPNVLVLVLVLALTPLSLALNPLRPRTSPPLSPTLTPHPFTGDFISAGSLLSPHVLVPRSPYYPRACPREGATPQRAMSHDGHVEGDLGLGLRLGLGLGRGLGRGLDLTVAPRPHPRPQPSILNPHLAPHHSPLTPRPSALAPRPSRRSSPLGSSSLSPKWCSPRPSSPSPLAMSSSTPTRHSYSSSSQGRWSVRRRVY